MPLATICARGGICSGACDERSVRAMGRIGPPGDRPCYVRSTPPPIGLAPKAQLMARIASDGSRGRLHGVAVHCSTESLAPPSRPVAKAPSCSTATYAGGCSSIVDKATRDRWSAQVVAALDRSTGLDGRCRPAAAGGERDERRA